MATNPDPGKTPRPDDQGKSTRPPADAPKAKPAAPEESSDGGTAKLGRAKEPTPSDSYIDLGTPGMLDDPFASSHSSLGGEQEASDVSIVEWAKLVEDVPTAGDGSSATFDSPSDADWAAQVLAQQSGEQAVHLPRKPPSKPQIDLNAPPTDSSAEVPAASPLTSGGPDDEDSLAADLEVVRSTFATDALDSGKALTPPSGGSDVQPPPALHPGDSGVVNLDAPPPASASQVASSSGVDLEALDSGVSLEGLSGIKLAPSDAAEVSGVNLMDENFTVERSELDPSLLEQDVTDVTPSGRDLGGEIVESGVELHQPTMEIVEEGPLSGKLKGPIEAGDVLDDEAVEAAEVVADEGSSAVDLGAPVFEQTLSREDLDMLHAGAELGAAAGDEEPPALDVHQLLDELSSPELKSGDSFASAIEAAEVVEDAGEPVPQAEAPPRKTRISRGPARGTQLAENPFENEEIVEAGEVIEEPEELIIDEAVAEVGDDAVVIDEDAVVASADAAPSDSGIDLEALVVGESASAIGSGAIVIDELVEEPGQDAAAVSGVLRDHLPAPEEPAAPEEEASVGDEVVVGESGVAFGDSSVAVGDSSVAVGESSVALGDSSVAVGESSAAVGDSSVTAGAEKEAEEKPAKEKPARKPRSAAGAWVGGGFLGVLAGAGACVALYFGGLIPARTPAPQEQRPLPAPPAPVTFEAKADHLRGGDFEKAAQANIERIDEAKPEQRLARGEYRWLKYLKEKRVANAPLKADDEPVKQAVDDLQKAAANQESKAVAASALLQLGQIKEFTNDLNGARAVYQKGAEDFKNDGKLKRPFEAALDRLDTRGEAPAGVGRLPGEDHALALALTAVLLQAPPAPAGDADDEAGFQFWDAVKLARQQKYPEALKALEAARALHDKRRFAQLRKPQNPTSDPVEEIFLRSCDELKVYWALQEKLRGNGYLTAEKKDPAKALDELLKTTADQGSFVNALAGKLMADKVIDKPEDLNAGVDKLLAGKKAADARFAEMAAALEKDKVIPKPDNPEQLDKAVKDGVDKMLVERKAAETKIAQLEKAVADEKKKADTAVAAAKELETTLRKELQASNDAVNAVKATLAAEKFVDEKADTAKVVQGVKDAVAMARLKDPQGSIRKLQAEVSAARDELKERRPPEELLPVWLAVLEDRGRKDLASQALVDAGRVLKDAKAAPARKAEAQAVIGLALRNEEKFAEARPLLEEARKNLDTRALPQVAAALEEVSNPAATYRGRAKKLRDQGKYDEAVAALTKALAAVPPEQQGALLAERSLTRLEAGRAKSRDPLRPDDPNVAAARKDAEQAAANVAEGHYAAGRIAEELGQLNEAVAYYRKAVAAHEALDADGSRYRVALARVLVRLGDRPAPRGAGPKPVDTGVRLPTPPAAESVARDRLEALLVLAALGLQPPVLPPASTEEAQRLADEILKAKPGTIPFEVRAQALAIKGLYTEALTTYAEGLRAYLNREHADGLLLLIETHPTLRRPESLRVANPLNAERHYGVGRNLFNERRYAEAEREFLEAIRNDALDARYHYFLGLARLAQNKRDAYEDFAQGAKLEAQERPSRAAVSAALERVQGDERVILNQARDRTR